MNEISIKIKELRLEYGLSIIKLSELIGVTDSTISRWERGITDITGANLIKLCDFFGVTADYLLGRDEYK